MDNQHRKIAGYRELDQNEVDLINKAKAAEQMVGDLLKEIASFNTLRAERGRWQSLARTHLETGFMFAVKAIAAPAGGLGDTGNR